jgi:hypothetical protein
MNFNTLDTKTKALVHTELKEFSQNLGGINFLLQLIEDIKKEKTHPLLNKTSIYHFSKGKVSWNKKIYKDTLELLLTTIKEEEKENYSLNNYKAKVQKSTVNMKKALKPVILKIEGKEESEDNYFNLNIIDSKNEDHIKISFFFKIIFFYNVSFAKEALNYKAEE